MIYHMDISLINLKEDHTMIRKIIRIDEEKCNGCGACANACHEGAIDMVNGKAKLARENFCDGFGDCLPACPTGAITFEERDAPAYDDDAVQKAKLEKALAKVKGAIKPKGGCSGSVAMALNRGETPRQAERNTSALRQWPVQIKLLPVKAPFYDGAKLLIAADCTAYAYANIHEDFMKGRVTAIGCPKLDEGDYAEKLTAIIANNDIKSVTILRMEVPCCGGIQRAAENALRNSGKFIPWQVVTISRDGQILD